MHEWVRKMKADQDVAIDNMLYADNNIANSTGRSSGVCDGGREETYWRSLFSVLNEESDECLAASSGSKSTR